jgi:hypothetical protein
MLSINDVRLMGWLAALNKEQEVEADRAGMAMALRAGRPRYSIPTRLANRRHSLPQLDAGALSTRSPV